MTKVMLRPKTYSANLDHWMDQLLTKETLPAVRGTFRPAVNMLESEDALRLEITAPGLKKEDFQIELDKGVLHIKASRKVAYEDVKVLREEFGSYEIDRSFKLGRELDGEQVEATYENGILSLRIPKAETALARRIEVA